MSVPEFYIFIYILLPCVWMSLFEGKGKRRVMDTYSFDWIWKGSEREVGGMGGIEIQCPMINKILGEV